MPALLEFRKASWEVLHTLRQKRLALDAYVGSAWQMQDVVDGMFRQPSEYMAMMWRIERNAYEKAPTLEEYLRMCEEEKETGIGELEKDFMV